MPTDIFLQEEQKFLLDQFFRLWTIATLPTNQLWVEVPQGSVLSQ